MIKRSFKPAKCTIALKLAIPRLKLMKNKREAQTKQLKRELAQLLESGQDQTARIRVEHVVREEKTMAAYELIGIYCELIVARMLIIESQKNCPIDLKEAVSSVIFASARCADIPELKDVCKHFTAKYGKEFVSAALELRPDCGVSRLLIEKLSAKAPDGLAKIKILTAIAEEHNINWNPESFGDRESKPPEGLLNGPNTFQQASQCLPDPSKVQAPPSCGDQRSPVDKVRSPDRGPPNIGYTRAGSDKGSFSSISPPNVPHPGSGIQETKNRISDLGDGNTYSPGRQRWNFEFKDATAAAQAAAESAELASMAARAAAELSSRENITRQNSRESYESSTYGLRDEATHKPIASRLPSENQSRVPVNHSPRMHYEEVDNNEQDHLVGEAEIYRSDSIKSSNVSVHPTSFKSGAASFSNMPMVNNHQRTESQNNSSDLWQNEPLGYASMKINSDKDLGFVSEQHGAKHSEDAVDQDVIFRKQSSHTSSRSHSSTFSDDHDFHSSSSLHNSRHDHVEDPFVFSERNEKEMNRGGVASVVFDEYGSDNDDLNVGLEDNRKERHNVDYPGSAQKFTGPLFTDTNISQQDVDSIGKPSPPVHMEKQHHSVFLESEHLTTSVHSQGDDAPTFDNSDSSSSVSEEEPDKDKSKIVGRRDPSISVPNKNISFDEANVDIFMEKLAKVSDDTETRESHFNSGNELNFGKLKGGLRNKGYSRPPYSKTLPGNASSPREVAEDASTRSEQTSPQPAVKLSGASISHIEEPNERKETPRTSATRYDYNDDDFEKEPQQWNFGTNAEQYKQKAIVEENQKSSMRVPAPFFEDNSSDSDEDLAKRKPAHTARTNVGFSRRTKASSSNSGSNTSLSTKFLDKSSVTPDQHLQKQSSPRSSYAVEPHSTQPQKKGLDNRGSSHQQLPVEQVDPKPVSYTRRSSTNRSVEQTKQERLSETGQKDPKPVSYTRRSSTNRTVEQKKQEWLSETGQQADPKPVSYTTRSSTNRTVEPTKQERLSDFVSKKPASGSNESLKAPIEEESSKLKPSHVHPKLPDYDTLAARLQSLRQNR